MRSLQPIQGLVRLAICVALLWHARLGPVEASERELSPGGASGLSLGGFVVPVAVSIGVLSLGQESNGYRRSVAQSVGGVSFAYGVIIGPSTAHLYLGEYKHAAIMSGIRLGTFGLMMSGAYVAAAECLFAEEAGGCSKVGAPILLAGLVGYGVAVGYDFYDATRAARRHRRVRVVPHLAGSHEGRLSLLVEW